jgi:hypothetical protein
VEAVLTYKLRQRESTAAQLLLATDSGPFTAPGAEAPLTSLDERRHAACRLVGNIRQSGVPLSRSEAGASLRLKRRTLGRRIRLRAVARFP